MEIEVGRTYIDNFDRAIYILCQNPYEVDFNYVGLVLEIPEEGKQRFIEFSRDGCSQDNYCFLGEEIEEVEFL